MSIHLKAALLSFSLLTGALCAQSLSSNQFVLPADKTEVEITIPMPGESPNAQIRIQPLLNYKEGTLLAAQPVVLKKELKADEGNGTVLTLHLSAIYFWGKRAC